MQLKNVSDETLTITEQSHTEEIASGKSFIVSDDKAREVINMYGNKVEQKLKVDGDGASGEISDLDDVDITNLQDGDGIIFDDDIEKFINVGLLDRDKVETAVNLLTLGTADDNVYYSDADGSKSTHRQEFYSVKDIDIHEYVGKQWTTHSSHPTNHQARSVCFYNSIGRFISGWNCLSTGTIDEALGGVIPEGAYYCNMSFRKIGNTTMPEIETTIPVQSHNALDQDISVSYNQITDKPYTSYANKQELPNANHRLPTFNFQFDDNNTQDEHVVELFDKYELRCGFACIADNTFITSGAGATRYLGYQKKGYEIISHSTDATAMNTDSATVEAIETKLRTSKQKLVQAGFKVRGWVTPSSTMNDKYIPSLSKFYDFSYTVYNGNMSSQVRCDRTQRLDKLSRINIESNTTADLKSAIDTTIANNGFLTFYCHSVRLDGGYTNNREGLEEVVAYLREKMDNLQCYVLTPSEAVDYYFHTRDNDLEHLSNIGDVEITTPTDGDVLSYNATSEKWENKEVEADSSNVSYRGITVEQALDIANPLVENLINENTERINGFWDLDGQGNPEINPAIGGLADFVSFYIPVTEGETLYVSYAMDKLWCAYLNENKQAIYVGQFNGSTVTIPTGQNIAYFSYPMRYALLPVTSVTRTPAQYGGNVDVYRMNGSGEAKMDYPSAGRVNNTYSTNMTVSTTSTTWRADYTYDFDNNVFGIGTGFYVLGVNTVDKTAIALDMDTKIYIFNIGLNTFVEGTYEVPEEWKKDSARKSPSRLCGCTRADDENNYILRSEGLSDLIIPKSAVKTFVESNSKVFNNYTSVSGMVYFYGSLAYKYKSIYSVRHKGPLVEKKSEVEVDNHWANKTWYAYGTSMTDTTMNGYTVELQSLLGANLTNYGKGGSGIIPSLHGGTSGDNTYTRVKRTTDGKTNADLITLEIIPNDMSGTLGTPTDNYADGTTETFCGCLNELLQYLQVNTNAQIVVLIATRSRYNHKDTSEKYPPESENATKWLQWTDAAKECCRRNCVPFIDGQSNCGLGYARVKDGTKYVRDQIHLTPLGAKNLGQYFYSQIKNIPLFYSA